MGAAQIAVLGVGNHRVPAPYLGPAPRINIERQEPARLRRGRLQITVTFDHQPRGRPSLGDRRFGATPVTLGAEHRAQPRRGWLTCQRSGSETLPEPPARLQRPRPQDLELGHMLCYRLPGPIADTRTVTGSTDINAMFNRGRGTDRPAHRSPISAARSRLRPDGSPYADPPVLSVPEPVARGLNQAPGMRLASVVR